MKNSPLNKLLPLSAALLIGTALAHTQVTKVVPAQGSSVTAPSAVALTLNEPINLRFSTFKVYALPAGTDAATFTKTKINLKDDAEARADAYSSSSNMAAKLSIPLQSHLKAGQYVVMWRILSDDGHPVSGQSTFSIK
ncbi:copper resistance CopC family protein [Deinococcus psychrotolerans]|uniref:copper resistance CopC family protein n=1 Tax=Deinococcus psychrotolerans TaxID=2489213 RepID=UPI001F151643|nr:copper resistance CopC family protein [Deinococcus psychrotolerans]